jgi:hypothetical protein
MLYLPEQKVEQFFTVEGFMDHEAANRDGVAGSCGLQ